MGVATNVVSRWILAAAAFVNAASMYSPSREAFL
jgi:hypothetical protein